MLFFIQPLPKPISNPLYSQLNQKSSNLNPYPFQLQPQTL